VRTLEAAGFTVDPYQAPVPSFGVWGYCLARPSAVPLSLRLPDALSAKLRFLNERTLQGLFDLPADAGPVTVEINRLDNQTLVRYYEEEWKGWN
jgi:spermidine synthase